MLVYLLRHGKTTYNEERRYQGVSDPPLSAAGRRALSRAKLCPSRVYVSPLKRAVETTELLFPEAEQIPVPGLREMNFGRFEGRTYQEMAEDPDYQAWVAGGCVDACPGGESRSEASQRICTAFEELIDKEQEQLVVVAHGGTQMAILERYGCPERDYYQWQSTNGGGFLLDGGDWRACRKLRLLREIENMGMD